jgi:branched-subunit amino acid aminotransferase/4-amino-4-deoxychorismate lyase
MLRDLESADAIFLCNSLRGMREVKLSAADSTLQLSAQ